MDNIIRFNNIEFNRLGIGTYNFGFDYENEKRIILEAFKNGVFMIDTAEMYENGKSEVAIGKSIKEIERNRLFIIGKILPNNINNYLDSCKSSLKRLNIDYFDLYLLHWKDNVKLDDFVNKMEHLKALGLIKNWGVSNFDVSDLEELFKIPNGNKCFVNQCLYNVVERGVEYDLIPWCKKNNVLFMAYSPLCNNKINREKALNSNSLKQIAKKYNTNIETIMLAFILRNENINTICKTSNLSHLYNNLNALNIKLDEFDLKMIDTEFNPPTSKIPLQKI